MDDPHGPTRVMPKMTAPQRPLAAPSDDRHQSDVLRAAGAAYEVLGLIGEIGEGNSSGIAYLAQRRSTTTLDVLRLVPTLSYVEVLGTVGVAVPSDGDVCPSCAAPLRGGVRHCGNCKANLTVLTLSGAPDAMNLADWLAAKVEASRHELELLGQLSGPVVQQRGGVNGARVLVARSKSTSQIATLLFERPSASASAVLSLDQTNLLASVVESLFDTPVAVAPVIPEVAAPPLVVAPEAPPPIVPVPPQEPVAPRPPFTMPAWTRTALLGVSAAALVALLAWLVSSAATRLAERRAAATADSLRAATARQDSLRADSIRTALARADSVTVLLDAALPPNVIVTIDDATLSGPSARLMAGRHTLAASAPGYRSAKQTLTLRRGESVTWPSRPMQKQVAVVAAPVVSGCRDAARRSDWSRATDVCAHEASSPRGNAFAERTLGTMYERGLGVGRSAQLAGMWYSASAGHGDREAPYLHGLMLQSAGGGRRNQEEVARLFRLAAERGHADAQRALGMLYANGEGVARSDPEAAQWLHKSAAQGNDRAKQELARRRW